MMNLCVHFELLLVQKPRPGEENGRDYHFVSLEEFAELKASGDFVEDAKFSSNSYGTSKKAIKEVTDQGETTTTKKLQQTFIHGKLTSNMSFSLRSSGT